MNILLTCSGRRNYLVEYFKKAVGDKGKVYAVNSTPEATSLLVADGAFIAPPAYNNEYIDFLYSLCQEYEIGLLVSLIDLELPILAKHRYKFEIKGVRLAVSSEEVIEICNDKLKTSEFVKSLGMHTLFTTLHIDEALQRIQDSSVRYPLFIKPRWGNGSIGIQQAETEAEVQILFEKVKRAVHTSYLKYYPSLDLNAPVIIQEKAQGHEYGLDVINDLDGNYVATFVKRKINMRLGETEAATTESVPELEELGREIGRNLQHVGILDVDVFWDGNTPTLLEMNARFGGGYPFSHLAGANIPKAYINWAQGEPVNGDDLEIKSGIKGFKGIELLRAR